MVSPSSHSDPGRVLALVSLLLLPVLGSSAEADVILSVSDSSYAVGEVVSFALANETKGTIQISSWPGWVITDSLGSWPWPYPCEVIPTVMDVYAGGSYGGEWDQKDCSELQVLPGRYRLRINYSCDHCPVYDNSIEAWFTIGIAPVEPASWGRVKAVFRGAEAE